MIFVSGMVVYYAGSLCADNEHDTLGAVLGLIGLGLMGTSVLLLLARLMP